MVGAPLRRIRNRTRRRNTATADLIRVDRRSFAWVAAMSWLGYQGTDIPRPFTYVYSVCATYRWICGTPHRAKKGLRFNKPFKGRNNE
jgi:hypothetical protein